MTRENTCNNCGNCRCGREARPDSALKQQFENDGFVILRGAIPADRLDALRRSADDAIALAERNPKDLFCNYYMGHRPEQGVLYEPYFRFPAFADLVRLPAVSDALADIYAPNFYLFDNSLIYKKPGTSNEVPWHQDFIDLTTEPVKVIAWMALDDMTEANGCMYAVPGSHKHGFLPYKKFPGQTHHTRLDLSQVDLSPDNIRPLTMKAGDVLLFNQLVLHSSKQVESTLPRRAFRAAYCDFNLSRVPRGTPIVIRLDDPSALQKPWVDPNPRVYHEPIVVRAKRYLRKRLKTAA